MYAVGLIVLDTLMNALPVAPAVKPIVPLPLNGDPVTGVGSGQLPVPTAHAVPPAPTPLIVTV